MNREVLLVSGPGLLGPVLVPVYNHDLGLPSQPTGRTHKGKDSKPHPARTRTHTQTKKPETIKEVAESLQWYTGDDQEFAEKLIARSIEKWILENITHKFYWYPRGIKLTCEEKRSDCTDRAMLAQKMLEFVGIKC